MKILVTGKKSQLGHELMDLAGHYPSWTWKFLSKKEFNITDEAEVKMVLDSFQPDVIINTAAYTNVENAETEHEPAYLVNAEGPKLLSLYAGQALLIHISTDFVFSGDLNTPYTEEEPTGPINGYGKSKLAGENLIVENAKRYVIIRTSWLYGIHQKNFLKTMLKLAQSKPELRVVDDQIGTPTFSGDLAKVIVAVMEKPDVPNGIYHFSNEGVASWYDFAHAIFEYANQKVFISPVPAIEFPSNVRRPSFSVLNKGKLKKTLDYKIPHWRESLQSAVTLWKKGR